MTKPLLLKYTKTYAEIVEWATKQFDTRVLTTADTHGNPTVDYCRIIGDIADAIYTHVLNNSLTILQSDPELLHNIAVTNYPAPLNCVIGVTICHSITQRLERIMFKRRSDYARLLRSVVDCATVYIQCARAEGTYTRLTAYEAIIAACKEHPELIRFNVPVPAIQYQAIGELRSIGVI